MARFGQPIIGSLHVRFRIPPKYKKEEDMKLHVGGMLLLMCTMSTRAEKGIDKTPTSAIAAALKASVCYKV